MNEVILEVSEGLKDLSISRPRERLNWGIPVPNDNSQTIYVWLDALINYLYKADYPFQLPGQESAGGWPVDCHVIGKDIVRFHCIYWPAFLMALDIPLPRQILTHAHWTLGRLKMSKSAGVSVNPFFAIDRFGTDTVRFYLAHDGGIQDDAKYDNAFIFQRYETMLQRRLGNLVSRLVRSQTWNIQKAIHRFQEKPYVLSQEMLKQFEELPQLVASDLNIPDPGAGLRRIMSAIRNVSN